MAMKTEKDVTTKNGTMTVERHGAGHYFISYPDTKTDRWAKIEMRFIDEQGWHSRTIVHTDKGGTEVSSSRLDPIADPVAWLSHHLPSMTEVTEAFRAMLELAGGAKVASPVPFMTH